MFKFKRKRWKRYVLMAIVFSYLTFLILVPLAALVSGAFAQGLEPFLKLILHPDVQHALKLTLQLALASVLLNTVFGVIVAYVLVRHDFPGKRWLNAMVDLPFAVSPVIAGYMLILLFGPHGWFRGFMEATGIKVLFAFPGMLLATAFVSMPFVIREVMPILEEIGMEQEQAAETLGASGWQTFWKVTLPGIRWGLLYGISLTTARSIGEFGAVLVVSGALAGQTETATLFIHRALDERDRVSAYGVSLILAGLSFLILIGMEQFKKQLGEKGS